MWSWSQIEYHLGIKCYFLQSFSFNSHSSWYLFFIPSLLICNKLSNEWSVIFMGQLVQSELQIFFQKFCSDSPSYRFNRDRVLPDPCSPRLQSCIQPDESKLESPPFLSHLCKPFQWSDKLKPNKPNFFNKSKK